MKLKDQFIGSNYLRLWARSWYAPNDTIERPLLAVVTPQGSDQVAAAVSDCRRLCDALSASLRAGERAEGVAFSVKPWPRKYDPSTPVQLGRLIKAANHIHGPAQVAVIQEESGDSLDPGAYLCEGTPFALVRHDSSVPLDDSQLGPVNPLDFLLWIATPTPGAPSSFEDVGRLCVPACGHLPVGWQRNVTRRMAALLVSVPPCGAGYGTYPASCKRTAQALARRGYVSMEDLGACVLLERMPQGDAAVGQIQRTPALWGKDQPLGGLAELWDRHAKAGGSRVAWVDALPGSKARVPQSA